MKRIVCRKKGLPRFFNRMKGASRALMIGEVRVCSRDPFCLKLLVFEKEADLHYFWSKGLKHEALEGGIGVVSSLIMEKSIIYKDGSRSKSWYDVDRRYFAVMALCRDALTMDFICHESVHAGFAYAKRSRRKWPNQERSEEEPVAWPAGRIACCVNKLLRQNDLYPKQK